MPDQMPRQLAQIQDFSARAGEKVLDILGKQNPTSTIISDLIDRATRAYDSDQMAKAAALQESMRALGYNPDKIRGALSGAGFRDGIVGSKELQERYEKANQAQIAKTQLDNTLRVQGLQEQGYGLVADLQNHVKTLGPNSAYMWMEDNEEALKKNPYAYQAVLNYVNAANLSLSPYDVPKDGASLTLANPVAVKTQLDAANNILQRANALGINTSLSPEEALKMSNFDAWVADEAKKRGYEGDAGAYADFRENMQMAFNQLKKDHPTAPVEAILHAMRTNMDNGGIWWFDQEDINLAPAKQWLNKHASNWYSLYNDAQTAKKVKDTLESAWKENKIEHLASGIKTQIKKIEDAQRAGKIDATRAAELIAQTYAAATTANADIVNAVNTAVELRSKYPASAFK